MTSRTRSTGAGGPRWRQTTVAGAMRCATRTGDPRLPRRRPTRRPASLAALRLSQPWREPHAAPVRFEPAAGREIRRLRDSARECHGMSPPSQRRRLAESLRQQGWMLRRAASALGLRSHVGPPVTRQSTPRRQWGQITVPSAFARRATLCRTRCWEPCLPIALSDEGLTFSD